MRTTLDIADDVLLAAKELARRERKSIGEVISNLTRQAFQQAAVGTTATNSTTGVVPLSVSERMASYGIHPLPARGTVVSNELIDRLRDAEGI
jgi:predicted transposase YdaD